LQRRRLDAAPARDIALVDIGLPQMNGHEVAKAIRRGNPTLVALSGRGLMKDEQRSRAAGFGSASDLVNPVDFDRLLELVARPR
jgi:CheY-like chemotaxis protein